jgi:hypothetical protein
MWIIKIVRNTNVHFCCKSDHFNADVYSYHTTNKMGRDKYIKKQFGRNPASIKVKQIIQIIVVFLIPDIS